MRTKTTLNFSLNVWRVLLISIFLFTEQIEKREKKGKKEEKVKKSKDRGTGFVSRQEEISVSGIFSPKFM